MTQKHKDSQKAGIPGYSKVAARRQPQKDIPAKLKSDHEDDAHSTLSNGSAGKSSSSREAFARIEEEFEQAKQTWAQQEAIQRQKEQLQEQDLQQLFTQLQAQADQIRALQESMAKSQGMSSVSTTKTTNVVTGHKNTNFSSPASFLHQQGSPPNPFSPLGTNTSQNTSTTSGTIKNLPSAGFTTPAYQNQPSSAPTPFTHPPLAGHYWSQYVNTAGQVLWQCLPTPSPSQHQGTPSSTNGQSRSNLFTAPLGYITFDRKSWNVLTKGNTCNSDDLDDVRLWYDDLKSIFITCTQGREVLPDLPQLHKHYDFEGKILPPVHQTNHKPAKNEFNAMSSVLRVLLTKSTTFESNCDQISNLVTIHKSSSCGFHLLMLIFCDLFPHLGGTVIDVVDEISNLTITTSDTLDSFLTKTSALARKIDNTKQIFPPNSIVHKFIKELRRDPTVEMKLSPIFLAYNDHVQTHGANVIFPKTPYDIYKFLKQSGTSTTASFSPQKATADERITPTTCKASIEHIDNAFTPIETSHVAKAAIVDSKKAPLYPPKRDTRHIKKPGKRFNKCKLCNASHSHMKCPHRGANWSPVYIRQRVAKHNALYPHEKPSEDYINQSPPLLEATTKSFTKKANLAIQSDEEDIFVDAMEEMLENESDDDDIEPEIKMAECNYDPDEYTITSDGLIRY